MRTYIALAPKILALTAPYRVLLFGLLVATLLLYRPRPVSRPLLAPSV